MKVLAVLTVVLMASLASHAATEIESVTVIKKDPDAIFEDSSEFNRLDKTFSFTGQLFGVGPSNSRSQGFTAALFLNRNSVIELEVMGSSTTQMEFLGSNYNVDASSMGIHFKRFLGNSFYVRAGLDRRRVSYSYRFGWDFDSDFNYQVRRRFDGESTTATVVIGNQWQWSNFTLGCDWLGVVRPISSSVSSENVYTDGELSYENSRHSEEKDRYLNDSLAMGLRFYIGAAF